MEHGSFEEFYMREYRSVLVLARVLTGDRGLAEDITQDAFAAAFQAWDGLDTPHHWIRRVVANQVNSTWRRKYAEQRALDSLQSEIRIGHDFPESTEEFWALVRSLPPNQARAVALFYLEDRPVSEIAEILGCMESTARGHLSKGRRTLARKLGVKRD